MSSKKCTDMYKCTTCDCNFASKYSLERHTVRKHVNKIDGINGEIAQNSSNSTQNISNSTQNSSNSTQNSSNSTQNSSNSTHFSGNLNQEESDDDYGFETELTHCPSCKKEFKRQWCLYRHIKTCRFKGDKYNCEYCNKNFKHSNSKYKHYKICKIKNRTGIVIEEPQSSKEEQEHTIIQEQSIQNASVINNKNTIENQTNIENQHNTQNIIIVYNPDNMEFVTDKINYDVIQKLLQSRNIESKSQLVSDYGKEIFSIPENQCIKKNDLKSGHSEVHLGDDKWEMKLDKHIYPKLACSVANNMSDYLNSKKEIVRHEIFNKTMKFLDYMSDEGYINTDDKEKEKQIKQEYKDLIRELRLVIHSKTDKVKSKK